MKRIVYLQGDGRPPQPFPGLLLGLVALLLGLGELLLIQSGFPIHWNGVVGATCWPMLFTFAVLVCLVPLAFWHAAPYLEVTIQGMRVLPKFYYRGMSLRWEAIRSWRIVQLTQYSPVDEAGGSGFQTEQAIVFEGVAPNTQTTWSGTFGSDIVVEVLRIYAPEKEVQRP